MNIIQRDYIEREKKTLKPTSLGIVVSDLISKHFKNIVDVKFTAGMEESSMVIAINTADIEKNKVRGDLGITYDDDVLRLIDAFRHMGFYVGCVVITRYFGGTLLGTGGLVRAYSAAAIGAVEAAEIITYDIYTTLTVETTYSDYQKFAPIFAEFGYRNEDVRYTDKVILSGSVRKSNLEGLIDKIVQITSGRAKIEIIDEKFDF